MKFSKVLCIYIGHDASACLLTEDILAIAEERITRKKFFWNSI